jgi:hypothetical protein
MNQTLAIQSPDLTQRAPRSEKIRLGGYAMLPRILDKARASSVGKAGDYVYGNPMDQFFFEFTGITQEQLLERVKGGAGDWAVLLWVNEITSPKRAPYEIKAWSDYLERLLLGGAENLTWFAEQVARLNGDRTDILTIMDYLDVDDFVSFGGVA